jgi:myosin heavy subunit
MISKKSFIVIHSVCDVEYEIEDFVDKNKDELAAPLIEELAKSSNSVVAEIA